MPTRELDRIVEFLSRLGTDSEEAREMADVARQARARVRDICEDLDTASYMAQLERLSYEELFQHAPDAYLVTDSNGTITAVNNRAADIFAAPQRPLVGESLADFVKPLHREQFLKVLTRAATEPPNGNTRLEMQTARGRRVSAGISVVAARDLEGHLVGYRWIIRDMTEQATAEAALAESERRFREIADNINDVFWCFDVLSNRIVYVSNAYEALWGRKCEDLLRDPQDWLAGVHPEDRERVEEAAANLPDAGPRIEEYRVLRPDGEIRWVSDQRVRIRNERGRAYRVVGVITDITKRRNLEEAFLQAQKMEAVGRLAAGIAHDFNNLLMGINGCADIALNEIAQDSPGRWSIKEIARAARRGCNLTSQLLAFSRKRQAVEVETIDLNRFIQQTQPMGRSLLGEGVAFRLDLSSSSVTVRANAGQLEQILMNLLVNARDAMAGSGSLTIRTSRARPGAPPQNDAGEYARLVVTDTGHGMDERTRRRAFEPFFTTKDASRGTGLGLSTVYGIVTQLGGTIELDTLPGRGTAVSVFLPLVSELPEWTPTPVDRATEPAPDRTVLIVEDEPLVRLTVRHYLDHLGYTVLEAGNGAQALEICAKMGSIDLLLTDIVLPGMSGLQIAQRVETVHPGIPVVYMSAYPASELSSTREDATILQKPFTQAALAKRIQEALGEPTGIRDILRT